MDWNYKKGERNTILVNTYNGITKKSKGQYFRDFDKYFLKGIVMPIRYNIYKINCFIIKRIFMHATHIQILIILSK